MGWKEKEEEGGKRRIWGGKRRRKRVEREGYGVELFYDHDYHQLYELRCYHSYSYLVYITIVI